MIGHGFRRYPVEVAASSRRTMAFVLGAVLLAVMRTPSAAADGINFSWDECGAAGSQLKTFACDTNAGEFNAIGSFVPPAGVDSLLGMSAEIRVAATNLPDWWKHGSGQCRGTTSLFASFDFPPGACSDFWPGSEAGGSLYTIAAYGPNTARLVVQCAIPADEAAPVSASEEYYAFKLRLSGSKSTGAGSCAGCSTPVSLQLRSIQLFQPLSSGNDPILATPLTRNTLYWQASTPGPPAITSITPAAGAPGTVVTLSGSSLLSTTAVRFGAVAATFSVVSDAEVTTTVPPGARSGPITLDTPFGTATSSSFTVAPSIRHFLPKQASAGTTIYVTGRNFGNASAVSFNGFTASFTIDSDSLIRAVVPGAATTGPLSVTNPGGSTDADTLFRVGPTGGALDLSWDDCGLAGTAIKTFACNSNSGTPFTLVGSFVPPPGVNQLSGMIADLGVHAITLPDWWKHGSGQCRGIGALNIGFNFAAGPSTCSDAWASRINGAGFTYDVGFYGANSARLRISSVASDSEVPVDPNTEYYAFKVNITRNRTISDGSCSGCDTPVRITLHSLQLTQPASAGYDPVISIPFHRNSAFWQAEPGPVPRIDAFTPMAGAPGVPVTIQGQHFTGTTAVRFRGQPSSFTVDSDTQISTSAPAGARTGAISVTTPHGTTPSESLFVVKPDIVSFFPRTAPVGHTITINGVNFTRTTAVTFNGTASSFSVPADSVIQAVVPAGATDGPIAVTNAGGTDTSDSLFHVGPLQPGSINLSWDACGTAGSALKTFACNTNSGTPFTMVASFKPPPDVTELIGMSGDIRLASSSTLPDWWKHGAGFCRGTGDLSANFDFTSAGNACVDFWQGQAAGSLGYTVGYSGANTARIVVTCSLDHTLRGPVSPNLEYYAFKLNIARTMALGNGSCAGCETPVSLTLSQIQLFQAAQVQYDPVITAALDRKTIMWQGEPGPLPDITSFTPEAGAPGTVVTIRGLHFTGSTLVTLSGQSAPFTTVSDSVIHATVPAGARTGPFAVRNSNGTTQAAGTFVVAPRIVSFAPRQAPVATPITISGANFTFTSSVLFNGTAATFTIQSDSLISAPVPAGATDGPITVTNPGGSAVSDSMFRIGPVMISDGGINLSWDDCGLAGVQNKTFACMTNVGLPFSMIASFIPPPGIEKHIGIAGQIDIRSDNPSLPDWWRIGAGQCRGTTALFVSFDFTTGPFTCYDPFVGQAAGGYAYDVGFGAPNRARLRVQGYVPADVAEALDPETEYYGFKVSVTRAKTTGTESCAGCAEPMCIVLNEVQLLQPEDRHFDPVLTAPMDRNFVTWQGGIPGCPQATAVQASVTSTEAWSDRIRVVWTIADAQEAAVYRREGDHAWVQVARLAPDGSHRVTFDDYDVVAGARYSYRLGFTLPEGLVFLGETSVSVPGITVLAMSGLRWDAGSRNVRVSLAVPRAENATFEIYDLGGRRFVRETLEGLTAGTHDVRIGTVRGLKPGVYFARLSQNSNRVTARFVVVQ